MTAVPAQLEFALNFSTVEGRQQFYDAFDLDPYDDHEQNRVAALVARGKAGIELVDDGVRSIKVCPIAWRRARDLGLDAAGVALLRRYDILLSIAPHPWWSGTLVVLGTGERMRLDVPIAKGIMWGTFQPRHGGWDARFLKVDGRINEIPSTVAEGLKGRPLSDLVVIRGMPEEVIITGFERYFSHVLKVEIAGLPDIATIGDLIGL